MQKSFRSLFLACALIVGVSLLGCGKQKEPSKEQTNTPEVQKQRKEKSDDN